MAAQKDCYNAVVTLIRDKDVFQKPQDEYGRTPSKCTEDPRIKDLLPKDEQNRE